jgi:hypothetical protein
MNAVTCVIDLMFSCAGGDRDRSRSPDARYSNRHSHVWHFLALISFKHTYCSKNTCIYLSMFLVIFLCSVLISPVVTGWLMAAVTSAIDVVGAGSSLIRNALAETLICCFQVSYECKCTAPFAKP